MRIRFVEKNESKMRNKNKIGFEKKNKRKSITRVVP
jgi:hypothetical protein